MDKAILKACSPPVLRNELKPSPSPGPAKRSITRTISARIPGRSHSCHDGGCGRAATESQVVFWTGVDEVSNKCLFSCLEAGKAWRSESPECWMNAQVDIWKERLEQVSVRGDEGVTETPAPGAFYSPVQGPRARVLRWFLGLTG